ncbi:prolyl oligopeptidase family serine peptidase [Lederbergia citrea]|uniref:Prolyl oligopeptidase family serine peptidase n=1 Tax=Lederbergia citrea TaxID=2833581 RepID=A0A942UQL5_9BACI|nr:prolyl oligopeptidase family serine peptidase [Lederbergia citrea]MBS4204216.1 prolyl oligopeptidase family serine peptidase [Lederbergia citrea]MBS4221199.1 prolyl oligopeptidase family serine peptidase [Lederbergia citrea]
MKVFFRFTLMFGIVLMLHSIMGSTSEAGSTKYKKKFGQIERVDVISEVLPEGEKVVAVAIEYKKEINSKSLSASTYEVNALHGENAASRTITKVYANTAPELDVQGKNGKYVIIELDTNDPIAGTLFYDVRSGINTRLALEYTVTQEKAITTAIGNQVPSTPNILVNSGEINLVVDEFSKRSISDEKGNFLNYRLFEPDTNREKQPLVLFLHGGGERGVSNDVQLLANRGAISWADPEQQAKNSAFVAAPQAAINDRWTSEVNISLLLDLIETLKEEYPIDPDRIYVTGISMGGMGTWSLIQDHSDLFAAAIPVCGTGDMKKAGNLVNLPIWVLHSADDATVNVSGSRNMINAIEASGATVTRGEYAGNLERQAANQAAQQLLNKALDNDSHTLYTEFLRGTTPINSHFSWIPTYENDIVKDWLFTNVKGQ